MKKIITMVSILVIAGTILVIIFLYPSVVPLQEDITVASEGSDLFAYKNNPNFKNVIDIANEILKFQPKKKPIDLKIN